MCEYVAKQAHLVYFAKWLFTSNRKSGNLNLLIKDNTDIIFNRKTDFGILRFEENSCGLLVRVRIKSGFKKN